MSLKERQSQWGGVCQELLLRLENAIKSVYFTVFFIFLITVGALGIWLPPIIDPQVKLLNSESLFTYAGPLLAMLLTDYFLLAEKSKLASLGLALGFIATGFMITGYIFNPKDQSFYTIIGTFLTLFMVIVASANDGKFDEKEITEDDMVSPTGSLVPSRITIKNKKN